MADDEVIVESAAVAFTGDPAILTLEIRPDSDDADHVRLTSFISQLDAFREVLRHVERVMYGSEGNVYYRIASLSQNSPALVTIEAIPATPRTDFGPAIFDGVVEKLESLAEAGDDWVPGDLDLPALLAFQEFAPTNKRRISELVVRAPDRRALHLDADFGSTIRKAIGPDDLSYGEVDGALEVVNLHRRPRFEVYPALSDQKVTCRFAPELKATVIAALDRYVRVTGRLHYKRWSRQPHAVDIESIAVLPTVDEIEPLETLRGIAPNITEKDVEDAKASLWW